MGENGAHIDDLAGGSFDVSACSPTVVIVVNYRGGEVLMGAAVVGCCNSHVVLDVEHSVLCREARCGRWR